MTAISAITPQTADRIPIASAGLEFATVTECVAGGVLLEHKNCTIFGKAAMSCLVSPEAGDFVLVATGKEHWVISILLRYNDAPMQLRAERDLVISAAASLSLHATTLNLQASKANLLLAEVLHIGHRIIANVASLKLVGGVIETLVDRVLLRTKWCQRFVEQADISRSGMVDQSVIGSFSLQAENTFITAGGVVRMDASQIHMG